MVFSIFQFSNLLEYLYDAVFQPPPHPPRTPYGNEIWFKPWIIDQIGSLGKKSIDYIMFFLKA
jgi:hypothetical protein